jgi:predicted nucleic acid-binding protein
VPRNVVVDAGPIVASLIEADTHHRWTTEQWARLKPPMLTCESVLSEAGFILKRLGGDPSTVPALVDRGVLRIGFSMQDQAASVRALMQRYGQVPMSLADACLVRMTELLNDPAVMTFDSDFRIYRRSGRAVVPLIAPEGI